MQSSEGSCRYVLVPLSSFCGRLYPSIGRIELRSLLILYLITLPLQLVTTGSLLEQGSTALVAVTAVHAGVVVALFWSLLANAIVATQIVEDGTLSSLIVRRFLWFFHTVEEIIHTALLLQPFHIFTAITLGVGIYISLDVALGVTSAVGGVSNPPESSTKHRLICANKHLAGFVRLPYSSNTSNISSRFFSCAVAYLLIMAYIVLRVLNETRPMWYYVLAATLFVLSQLAWFLLSRVICKVRQPLLW